MMGLSMDCRLPPRAAPIATLHRWGGLVRDLQAACLGPADGVPWAAAQALAAHLGDPAAVPQADWLADPAGYRRYLIHADPVGRFSIVALVWAEGQRTPVHGHYTWCAYHVLSGVLREERFQRVPGAPDTVRHRDTVLRPAGTQGKGHAGLDIAHRLCHEAGSPAVSIHVYGIDAGRVASHVNRIAQVS